MRYPCHCLPHVCIMSVNLNYFQSKWSSRSSLQVLDMQESNLADLTNPATNLKCQMLIQRFIFLDVFRHNLVNVKMVQENRSFREMHRRSSLFASASSYMHQSTCKSRTKTVQFGSSFCANGINSRDVLPRPLLDAASFSSRIESKLLRRGGRKMK